MDLLETLWKILSKCFWTCSSPQKYFIAANAGLPPPPQGRRRRAATAGPPLQQDCRSRSAVNAAAETFFKTIFKQVWTSVKVMQSFLSHHPIWCNCFLDNLSSKQHLTIYCTIFHSGYLYYREFSPYANFITANFITAVFQNYY